MNYPELAIAMYMVLATASSCYQAFRLMKAEEPLVTESIDTRWLVIAIYAMVHIPAAMALAGVVSLVHEAMRVIK